MTSNDLVKPSTETESNKRNKINIKSGNVNDDSNQGKNLIEPAFTPN